MSVALHVSTLALRQLVGGACAACGAKGGEEAIVEFLMGRFTDQSQRLPQALRFATERAWQALELALAGESFWQRCKTLVARGEDQAFARQIRAFLDSVSLEGIQDGGPAFRSRCLQELRAARRTGALLGQLSQRQLARKVSVFARFNDPQSLLQAEWHLLDMLGAEFTELGHPNLARLMVLRPAQGESVLALGARYFFRRAVESDPQLFQGLAFAQMEKLAQTQEQGFTALAEALTGQGQRLEQLLGEVQEVVAQTHEAVLDLHAQMQGQSETLQQLNSAVLKLLDQHQLQRRELRLSDSLSIRNDGERQLVRQLVARYRALPEEEQRRVPSLLNALGKLEVVAGDFESAQHDFQKVATLTGDPNLQAEAHYHAYQAALQRRDWEGALRELQTAAQLAPERLALFPLDKYKPTRILGAGGFGVAFLCQHAYARGWVVVKALTGTDLDQGVEQIFAEATALRQVEHPAIVRLQDCAFTDPGRRERPYLAMDYFPGVTLEEQANRQPLSQEECCLVACQIAAGLQAAHGRGILHRDVKPANVLVRQEGNTWQVKLIDFGLALKPNTLQNTKVSSKTLLGSSIAGTLEYAAPEQLGRLEGVPVTPAADVYGFAKTCCFALFQTPEPTLRHWKSISGPLADLLGQCLEKHPTHRPQHFGAVLAQLNALSPTATRVIPVALVSEQAQRADAERAEQERKLREAALLAQEERHRLEEQERRLREAADRAESERRLLEEQERQRQLREREAEDWRRKNELVLDAEIVEEKRSKKERERDIPPLPKGDQKGPPPKPSNAGSWVTLLLIVAGIAGALGYYGKVKIPYLELAPRLAIAPGISTPITVAPGGTVNVLLSVAWRDWSAKYNAIVRRESNTVGISLPNETALPQGSKAVNIPVTAGANPGIYKMTLVAVLQDPRRSLGPQLEVTIKVVAPPSGPNKEKPKNGDGKVDPRGEKKWESNRKTDKENDYRKAKEEADRKLKEEERKRKMK